MDTGSQAAPRAPGRDRQKSPILEYHTKRSTRLYSRRARNFSLALGEGSVRWGCDQWMICSYHGAASSDV
jgi:hypothetical protein